MRSIINAFSHANWSLFSHNHRDATEYWKKKYYFIGIWGENFLESIQVADNDEEKIIEDNSIEVQWANNFLCEKHFI